MAAAANLNMGDRVLIPNTNVSMPRLGFGTYKVLGDDGQTACRRALGCGYRHFDSAQVYGNEADVGVAVAQSLVRREDVFLTTKIYKPYDTLEETYTSALDSVEKIGGKNGYVDLFLIHKRNPTLGARKELWQVMESLYQQGKAKAIGVSNYSIPIIKEMREYARVWPPHANQIELHPWCQQRELVKYCQDNGIIVQGHRPLVVGEKLKDPTLNIIASKHRKKPAHILIRYSLQKNWVTMPRSGNWDRIEENADVFDFALDEHDMETLDGLDMGSDGAQLPTNTL